MKNNHVIEIDWKVKYCLLVSRSIISIYFHHSVVYSTFHSPFMCIICSKKCKKLINCGIKFCNSTQFHSLPTKICGTRNSPTLISLNKVTLTAFCEKSRVFLLIFAMPKNIAAPLYLASLPINIHLLLYIMVLSQIQSVYSNLLSL